MAPRYTISGDSLADLRVAFDELFGDSAAAPAENGKGGKGSRKPRGAAVAPDPAPIPEADPFNPTGAPAPQPNDPFNPTTTAQTSDPFAAPALNDPFGAPQTAPVAADPFGGNPKLDKLISIFREKVKEHGTDVKVGTYIIQNLGLSPSLPFEDAIAALRKAPQETIDKLLHQVGGA